MQKHRIFRKFHILIFKNFIFIVCFSYQSRCQFANLLFVYIP